MSEDLKRLAAAEIKRRAILNSLPLFDAHMASSGELDFRDQPVAHHKLMIEHVSALIRGDIRKLLVIAPPSSAKSTYCGIRAITWALARHPDRNFLCVSNTATNAEIFNRRRRNICLTPEWRDVAGTSLAPDFQSVEMFGTQRGGTVRAAGVGAAIPSYRSWFNLLDDPISSLEQALSPTQLDGQWAWFHHSFRQRLGLDGRELIVSTRWAQRDIAGRLLDSEGKQWTVLRLPLECDASENDPLQRQFGERLWPQWFTDERVAEAKRDPLLFSTQYQGVPLDDKGSWVSAAHIQYSDSLPVGEPKRVIAIDSALSVGKGDFSVVGVAQLDWQRKVHLIDMVRGRIGPDKIVDELFELIRTYQPDEVIADDDSIMKSLKVAIVNRARSEPSLKPFYIHLLPMMGRDKETRAAAIRAEFLRGNVYFLRADWNAAAVAEVLSFPGGAHDDIVDMLGLIGRRLPALSPAIPDDVRESQRRQCATRLNPRTFFDPNTGKYMTTQSLNEMFDDHGRKMRMLRRYNR